MSDPALEALRLAVASAMRSLMFDQSREGLLRADELHRAYTGMLAAWNKRASPPGGEWQGIDTASQSQPVAMTSVAEGSLASAGDEPSAAEACMACGLAFKVGDGWLPDASGGLLHFACCGPERESYTNGDGDPLGPDDPIPEPLIWEADPSMEVDCLQYARDMAIHLAETHYPNGPKFQPFDTMSGLLSQIDNMICGLQRKPCEHVWHDGVASCVNCGAPREAVGVGIEGASVARVDMTPPSGASDSQRKSEGGGS